MKVDEQEFMENKKSKIRTIVSVSLSIFTILITIFILFVVIMMAAFPSRAMQITGFRAFTISYTRSMEPTLKYNDLIIVKKYDFMKIEQGDIISFYAPIISSDSMEIVTHRVEKVVDYEGRRYLVTKGDNIDSSDVKPVTIDGYDYTNKYVGKLAFKSSFLGQIVAFLKSGFGVFVMCMLTFSTVGLHIFGIFCKKHEARLAAKTAQDSKATTANDDDIPIDDSINCESSYDITSSEYNQKEIDTDATVFSQNEANINPPENS